VTTEEELETANQEGYNEGKLIGIGDGLARAAVICRDRASSLFLAEREKEARALRDIVQFIIETADEKDQ